MSDDIPTDETMSDSAMLAEILATMREVRQMAHEVQEQVAPIMAAVRKPGGLMQLISGRLTF